MPTPRSVREHPDAVAWPSHGFAAGAIGAAIVALVLLLVDLAAGRPFWTPAALGYALFTGDRLTPPEFEAWSHLASVVGYTAIHGAIFVGYGACAAFFLMTARRVPSVTVTAAATAGVLFVLFELTFLAQALIFDRTLVDDLAAGWIAVSNALAAAAMGVFLARRAGPRAPRAPEGLPKP